MLLRKCKRLRQKLEAEQVQRLNHSPMQQLMLQEEMMSKMLISKK